MSKYPIRLIVLLVFVCFASVVSAQKRPFAIKSYRTEVGKVASIEEPDFTRFYVVTDTGTLAVFDADEDWDGRDEPASQLAYWHDFATEQLFFFDQLLFTEADVLQSVAAMQRDLTIDPAPILGEKPEFAPLPEITSSGQWRPAIEAHVLTVMAGGTLGAREDGEVSGVIMPCAPNPNCDPAAAAARSGPLSAPVRGTLQSELFVTAQRGTGCNCGAGPGPGPSPDPFRNIRLLAEHLIVMEDDLLTNHFDPAICPFTEVTGEVIPSVSGTNYASSAPIKLNHDGQTRRTGSISVTTTDGSDTVGLQIVTTLDDGVTGPDPQWTLNQTMRLNGEELRFSGSIHVVEASGNSYTLAGGWTYSVAAGPVIDPSSDPGFQDALVNLQGFEMPVVAGVTYSPGAILSIISNVTTLALNYLRDLLYPYAAPATCYGLTVGAQVSGPSCPNGFPPCLSNIPELAKSIDSLTNVSPAFKKCMKGRFSCGGSFHPQLRFRCDDSSSCGDCGSAWGCNLGGRDFWYCRPHDINQIPTQNECECEMVVFHEAAHACGALDQLPIDANYSSNRIGCWFFDRCAVLHPNEILIRPEWACGASNND